MSFVLGVILGGALGTILMGILQAVNAERQKGEKK